MPATSMTSTPKPASPRKAGLTTTRTAMTPASATATKDTRTKNTRTERTRLVPTPAEHTRSGRETDFIHSGIAAPESINADAAVMQLQHNAVQLLGGGRAARFEKPGLRSRRHHQHHGPYVPNPVERHETPDPVRSDALKSRIHGVRLCVRLCVLTHWIPGFNASGRRFHCVRRQRHRPCRA